MSVWYAVGIKIGSKADQVTIEAEDALIAALRVKSAHPEAAITYVRKQNARGDRRHPHRRDQRRPSSPSLTLQSLSLTSVLTGSVAAVSVGLVDGEARLDLEYVEDRDADADFNLVMTGDGRFIEVQGSGEEATFTRATDALIDLGAGGIRQITALQQSSLGPAWPSFRN